jgi:hypothetical protein
VRHLQSYSSLPASGSEGPALSGLSKKLRLKPNHRVAIVNSPPGYLALIAPAPADLHLEVKADDSFDAVQLFVSSVEELRALGPSAIKAVKTDGLLWIAYPKARSTAEGTDLPAPPSWSKRDVLGEITGETGYKPVAFVKVDETWTALRFNKG